MEIYINIYIKKKRNISKHTSFLDTLIDRTLSTMAASSSLGFSCSKKKSRAELNNRGVNQLLPCCNFTLQKNRMLNFLTYHKELHARLSVSIQLHLLFELRCRPPTDGGNRCCRCSDVYIFLLVLVVSYLDVQVFRVLLPLNHSIGASLLHEEIRSLQGKSSEKV